MQRKPHDIHTFAQSWNFVILSYIQGVTYFSKEEQFSLSLQCKKSGQNTEHLTWIRTFRCEEVVKALASQEIKKATQRDRASRKTDLSYYLYNAYFWKNSCSYKLTSPKNKYQVCVCSATTTDNFVCIQKIHRLDKNTQF